MLLYGFQVSTSTFRKADVNQALGAGSTAEGFAGSIRLSHYLLAILVITEVAQIVLHAPERSSTYFRKKGKKQSFMKRGLTS